MKSNAEFAAAVYEKAEGLRRKQNRRNKAAKISGIVIAVLLITGVLRPGLIGSHNLMAGIEPQAVAPQAIDDRFRAASAEFAIELFRRANPDAKNALISPLSIMLALSMTQNGAGGETLAQMQRAVGRDIPLDETNRYLAGYVAGLASTPEAKLAIANAIWLRDDPSLSVHEAFLQANANYYNAAAYRADFTSPQVVKDINRWVNQNTDGMIDGIIDEIDANAIMYLLNTLAFDAKWSSVYHKENVHRDVFTGLDGQTTMADFLRSTESHFIEGPDVTGFTKSYQGGQYNFVALLPNEGLDVREYVQSLTGEQWLSLLDNTSNTIVRTALPKFSYEYDLELKDLLADMGMIDAFEPTADFSRMAHSQQGNIFIGSVLHKTFISVTEQGTRAAAVTSVIPAPAAGPPTRIETVILDRPFVYAIVDSQTNLPLFIGTVMDLQP